MKKVRIRTIFTKLLVICMIFGMVSGQIAYQMIG